jgi:membrane-associated phospholipid phosphatase
VLSLHDKLEGAIAKVFFRGRSAKASSYLAYVTGSVFLMLVVFYVLLNTVGYNWTGSLYAAGTGFRLDFLTGGLEDSIPFVPQMVIFYVYLFYPMVILTMLYFAFVEYKGGYALGWSLVAINAIALVIYAVFPVSTYWYREELLAKPISGFWASKVYAIFASDTSFNCFPSLHAAVSTICFYAWYRYAKVRPRSIARAVALLSLAVAVGVILSTLFIKQHYVADEISGIVLAWAVGKPTFDRLWISPRPAGTALPDRTMGPSGQG